MNPHGAARKPCHQVEQVSQYGRLSFPDARRSARCWPEHAAPSERPKPPRCLLTCHSRRRLRHKRSYSTGLWRWQRPQCRKCAKEPRMQCEDGEPIARVQNPLRVALHGIGTGTSINMPLLPMLRVASISIGAISDVVSFWHLCTSFCPLQLPASPVYSSCAYPAGSKRFGHHFCGQVTIPRRRCLWTGHRCPEDPGLC